MSKTVKIKDLSSEKQDVPVVLIAMIIFFREPREIKGGRAVWNLTLRDSEDTINMTVWGELSQLNVYLSNLTFGDVVEIHGPRAELPRENDKDYRPDVSSPLTLVLNPDEKRTLKLWDAPPAEVAAWAPLFNIPTKPPQSYTKVSDVYQLAKPAPGERSTLVNLLVTVGSVSNVMTGKNTISNLPNTFRCVTLYDYAGPTENLVLFVRGALAQRAGTWVPKETVLFIADAQIDRKKEESNSSSITINLHSKTIVTENPAIEDSKWLREAAAKAPENQYELMDIFVATITDLSAIRNIMTINTLKSKCGLKSISKSRSSSTALEPAFTAVLYVAVIGFDIDDPKERTLRPVCSVCKSKLSSYEAECYSLDCVDRPDRSTGSIFDFRVNLADHTGDLIQCLLQGEAAQRVLLCSTADFDKATSEEISTVKWHFLLERVVARVAVVPPSTFNGRSLVSILSLEVVSPSEVAQHIPMN